MNLEKAVPVQETKFHVGQTVWWNGQTGLAIHPDLEPQQVIVTTISSGTPAEYQFFARYGHTQFHVSVSTSEENLSAV
jgi:hypothetical protein